MQRNSIATLALTAVLSQKPFSLTRAMTLVRQDADPDVKLEDGLTLLGYLYNYYYGWQPLRFTVDDVTCPVF